MFGPGGVPFALREFADEIGAGAARVVEALTSIADALESRLAEEVPPDPVTAAGGEPRSGRSRRSRADGVRPRPPASRSRRRAGPVTVDTVRSALEELGPATAAQVADYINTAAGRRVVDGRSVGALARAAGARPVTRGGQRRYAL